MATPEITRKIKLCFESVANPLASPLASTMPQATIKIIMVRMAVARLEFTFAIPTFAKIAVSDANRAESKAYNHHIILKFNFIKYTSVKF